MFSLCKVGKMAKSTMATVRRASLLWLLVFLLAITEGRVQNDFLEHEPVSNVLTGYGFVPGPAHSTVNKVTLTQRGYIQFLRYLTKVPTIEEFTFCVWVKSNNLTFAHSLLSYSLDESKRVIRSWIGPHGRDINLAVLEEPLLSVKVNFQEHQWYHICQSWSSHTGQWDLFINAKHWLTGHNFKLQNIKLPAGGDIVVGQEYTDFDKGLDDGIEGDISGFNMVLSSTNQGFQRRQSAIPQVPFATIYRTQRQIQESRNQTTSARSKRDTYHRTWEKKVVPLPFKYPSPYHRVLVASPQTLHLTYQKPPPRRLPPEGLERNRKSLGSKLVELSHDCSRGRGAPLAGPKVLVSWTKTPVRVFGGAILKNVPPFCHIA